MKDYRRIVTIELTFHDKFNDKDAAEIEKSAGEARENIARDMQRIYGADDIHVKVQDFIADEEERNEQYI